MCCLVLLTAVSVRKIKPVSADGDLTSADKLVKKLKVSRCTPCSVASAQATMWEGHIHGGCFMEKLCIN